MKKTLVLVLLTNAIYANLNSMLCNSESEAPQAHKIIGNIPKQIPSLKNREVRDAFTQAKTTKDKVLDDSKIFDESRKITYSMQELRNRQYNENVEIQVDIPDEYSDDLNIGEIRRESVATITDRNLKSKSVTVNLEGLKPSRSQVQLDINVSTTTNTLVHAEASSQDTVSYTSTPPNLRPRASSLQRINPTISTKFSNVVGGVPQEILRIPRFYDPEQRQRYEAFGVKPPKAILLYGPPGTGKTLIAEALAGESQAPFEHIKISEIKDSKIGQSSKNIDTIFDSIARKSRKSGKTGILFIDEIDAIARKRSSHTNDENVSLLASLLVAIDGFHNRGNVLLLCATNRRRDLDEALLRRFDAKIEVGLPNFEKRKKVAEYYLAKIRHEFIDDELKKDRLVEKIAEITDKKSPSDIQRCILQAAGKAADNLEYQFVPEQLILEEFKKDMVRVKKGILSRCFGCFKSK